jgi:hypothetical protein
MYCRISSDLGYSLTWADTRMEVDSYWALLVVSAGRESSMLVFIFHLTAPLRSLVYPAEHSKGIWISIDTYWICTVASCSQRNASFASIEA